MYPTTKMLRAVLVSIAAATFAGGVRAQPPVDPADSTRIVLGAQYEAGGLRSFFWGDHYRTAWTTPVTLPVLDLSSHRGGLTPEGTGGGSQTTSLQLRGGDGRAYRFRLIDKDPTRGLPEDRLDDPFVEFLQDQVSSMHPLSALVVDALEEAAGVLHPVPAAFVIPDGPDLGPYRDDFGGRAGILVERPDDHTGPGARFAGLTEILPAEAIEDRVAAGRERVDAEAFLNARLLDLVIGDWNRHSDQWLWGRSAGSDRWVPIALDRDHAFSRRDGIVSIGARFLVRGFVGFGDSYSSIYDLHHASRDLDRWLLAGLDRATWDSAAVALQGRLSDPVIDAAVRRLPGPLYDFDGAVLTAALRRRRDELPAAAAKLYELLAEVVEIRLTDLAEDVQVIRLPSGATEVVASPAADVGASDGPPITYRRSFYPSETGELRLILGSGDDRVRLTAVNPSGARERRRAVVPDLTIRIVGGSGDDVVRNDDREVRVLFYDAEGENRSEGAASPAIDARPYGAGPTDGSNLAATDQESPIDSGRWLVPSGTLDFSSDFGLFVGLGTTRYDYGFRKDPYDARLRLIGGISTQGRFHLEYEADIRREASARHLTVEVTASELDVVNFFGLGNDTRRFTTSDSADARRRAVSFRPRYGNQLSRYLDVGAGVTLELSRTVAETNPFLSEAAIPAPVEGETAEPVAGADGFLQLGAFADVRYDSRDAVGRPTRGLMLRALAAIYPGLLGVGEEYVSMEASGRAYVTAETLPFAPTLAFRAGARKVWGDFPFFDAAIVGGSRTLRGFDTDRYAGDLSMYGTAELRLQLFEPRVLFFGTIGVLGFADVGRVYDSGASPGGWHTGYGGGLWITPLGVPTTVSAVIARGERTRVYVYFGMPF